MSTKDFLKKRALRIYPMVIVSVLVAYLLSVIARFGYNPEENINLMHLVEDMFFFGSRMFGGAYGIYNGPIWFLVPMFFSYLISVLIIVVTKKRRSIYWFLIPLFIMFFTGLGSNIVVPMFYVQPISNECFNFFLGFFFMAFLEEFERWRNAFQIPLRIVCLAVAAVFLYGFYKNNTSNPLGIGEMVGSLFCWIPLITALYGTRINLIFDNVVFRTLGGLSFHMFVWHIVVHKAWTVHFSLHGLPVYEGNLPSLLIFLTLVLVVSALSYTACELLRKYKIFGKLKEKLYRPDAAPAK